MIGNIIPEKRTQGMEMKGRTSDDHDDNFPVGMRVLVVDDDPICLLILENLLRRCQYDVTTCGQAILALTLLREKKNNFDLVISDVHMPDMDGFKLLELVGLEMDLPVIMMSANGETSAVMKGITHGACDYLLKPVRLEELKNIWQHVLRKRTTEKSSGSRDNHHREGHSRCSRLIEEGEQKSDDIARLSKKRKDQDDDEEEDENDHDAEDPSSLKKPRVVWTVELHQQFVQAVNTLGIDKAVPKRILELMNVQGLTRENVASHLQKYRLYLRRLSGVASHQGVIGSPFGSGRESPFSLGLVDGFSDLQMLAQSRQLSAHSLASMQAGIFGRLNGSIGLELPGLNSSAVLHYPSSAVNGSNNSVGRTPRNANTGMLAYLPPGSELSQLHQKQVSKHGEMGVQIEDNAPLLSMQQHQQLLAVDNSSYLTASRGNNHDMLVSQTNDAMIMQLMQQQQSQNRSRGLSNLSTEGNLKTLPTNASFPSNACGLAATWCNGSSPSEVATDSVQSALNIRETYSGELSVDDSKATMNSSVSTIKFLLGPASHNCPPNELGLPSITSVGNQRDIVTFDKLSNAKAFGIFNTALKQELDPTLRQECWQNQNQNLSQELRPVPSSIIKNQPTQSRVLHQGGVQTYLVQSQGQNGAVHNQNHEFDAKQMGNLTPPAFKGQCESKQSTADSQMNIKEECRISLLKMGGALFPEHCSSTDELMNILYKQQEPVRFADHDSALDVYPLKTCI